MLTRGDQVAFTESLVVPSVVHVRQGERGEIEAVTDAGDFWVRMHTYHAELADWQNCVYLPRHMGPTEILVPCAEETCLDEPAVTVFALG